MILNIHTPGYHWLARHKDGEVFAYGYAPKQDYIFGRWIPVETDEQPPINVTRELTYAQLKHIIKDMVWDNSLTEIDFVPMCLQQYYGGFKYVTRNPDGRKFLHTEIPHVSLETQTWEPSRYAMEVTDDPDYKDACSASCWQDSIERLVNDSNMTIRVKDWEDRCKFLAKDSNGLVHAFTHVPSLIGGTWVGVNKRIVLKENLVDEVDYKLMLTETYYKVKQPKLVVKNMDSAVRHFTLAFQKGRNFHTMNRFAMERMLYENAKDGIATKLEEYLLRRGIDTPEYMAYE